MLKFQKHASFEGLASGGVLILFLLAILGCLCGCGKSTVKQEQILFNILPDSRINDERPVYIVIRKVNRTEFQIHDYDFISDMVYANPPNESLLDWHVLMPGQKEKIKIPMPDKSDIGVYVLFAKPGENWKLLFEAPLKKEYHINVKNHEIEEYQKGFLW